MPKMISKCKESGYGHIPGSSHYCLWSEDMMVQWGWWLAWWLWLDDVEVQQWWSDSTMEWYCDDTCTMMG